MRRLLPDPGPTTVDAQLDGYRPWEQAPEERPFVAMNFAATLDGRATIGGVSGPIGSSTDTAMLVGLRTRFDAVMIGHGTMRAERYSGLDKRLIVVESGPQGLADLPALMRSLREEGVRASALRGRAAAARLAAGCGPGRRAVPDDRAEAERRGRGAADRRGRAARSGRVRAGLATRAGWRAVRPLQAPLS